MNEEIKRKHSLKYKIGNSLIMSEEEKKISFLNNYFNQIWYNVHDEKDSWFKAIPKGYVYSWYKGNVFPHDMETKILRDNHTICLFNNSAQELDEDMYEIEELKYLW